MALFWHQRDLRTRDNVGLARAAHEECVVPVFVFDPDLFESIGSRQQAFFMRGVHELRAQYRHLDSDLVVRSGTPSEVLPALAEDFDAETVYYNQHYRAERRDRQDAVEDALTAVDVQPAAATDLVLVDPAQLAPSYPTHSQFYKDWQPVEKAQPAAQPDEDTLASITDGTAIPEAASDIELPPAGYEAARDRLDRYCEDGIYSYNDTRDDLASAVDAPTRAVSRISPYIAAGMVGIREVWQAATDAHERADGRERDNVEKYRYELSWREQNYHLLYYNPDLAVANYREFPNEIQWRNDEAEFEAWKAGETGYPLVDAGMGQLNQEGYIHNRPRQVVASFLTKHLLVDWRRGARYFTEQLLDHDWANNFGNWQWIASTGTDSVDVRIFDPVSQLAKYDRQGTFVREYVPKLRGVAAEKIVEWPTLPATEREQLAPDYPDPIVDRNEAYERAQRVFETALGKR